MTDVSTIERIRQWVSRVAIAATLVLLAAGLSLFHAGSSAPSMTLFRAAFVVLVSMPIVAVAVVLIEEIRRRDWTFVAAALAVLGLIGYNILR